MTNNNNFIPVARPVIGEVEADAARRPILSGWVTQGPEVAAFEKEFAEYVGAKYACAVSSCTTALHMALLAVGVKPGNEVITVSHSFIATANSVRYCGAKPVFVDIQPNTFNIDPDQIEMAISDKTSAILCVHQMGMPCDLEKVVAIAKRHDLAVVEDAACAIGSEILWMGSWEKIGKPHGEVACFSFHPRKVITTGDGGMITTNNPAYQERFNLLRMHGMSVPTESRHNATNVIFESYVEVAYNYRMTDIQAAIGREQLRRLPEIVGRRRELADRYSQQLSKIDGLIIPEQAPWARSNWQSYCVRLPEDCDQKMVMQKMLDDGIATRRGIMCSHREPAYADRAMWSCRTDHVDCGCEACICKWLTESERATDRTIILPLYPQMTDGQQNTVIRSLAEACSEQR